jgi:hypothetical protein
VLKIILGRTGSQSLPSIIYALPRVFRVIDGLFRYVTLDNLFAVFVTETGCKGVWCLSYNPQGFCIDLAELDESEQDRSISDGDT